MARLRKPETDTSADPVVPDELRDFRHPTWMSVELARAWYRAQGMMRPEISSFWQMRWSQAVRAWATHHGIVTDPDHPNHPDWRRLREMGVSRVGSARLNGVTRG